MLIRGVSTKTVVLRSQPFANCQRLIAVFDPCAECSGISNDYERVNITRYGNTNQYSSVWITFHRPECKALDQAHH